MEGKKIHYTNGYRKRAGVALLILGKVDFSQKLLTRDKEGHFLMIKEPIHHEIKIIINISAPSIVTYKYIKQILKDWREK